MICLEEVLKTSLHDVLKMSWRRFCKTSWRRFEGVFKTSYQDALKMSWRRFCKRSWRRLEDVLNTSWQDVLKTYDQDEYIGLDQGLEDVFWRRMSKANMFVLIKTSWRRLLKTKSKDVFKTSSSRRMFAGFRHSTNTFFPFLAWCYSCPIKCSKDFFLNARVQ